MQENPKRYNPYLPLYFAIVLVSGFLLGMNLSQPSYNRKTLFSFNKDNQFNKINDVINYINDAYVDTVNQKKLIEGTIEDMLHQLDPHSVYIPAEDLQAVNEPLEGRFDGIGIEFHIQEDTIMVVTVVTNGPSEQLGIQSGDRIIKIDGKNVAGTGIKNDEVMKSLRGPSGTKVKVTIFRRGLTKNFDYSITRGKIPIYSVGVAYMLTPQTGYIKINHFAENTYNEYVQNFSKLLHQGMKNLVLDLRGNPGGYLRTAIQIADEFLPEGKMIVYTKGRERPKEEFTATTKGLFEDGKLVVLMDENSASASEIVGGALQDWDRATIIGRRSFGKGLVQEQTNFPDGSAVRLTIARYYTPTGRCIQKSYDNGYEEYENDIMNRYKNGEFQINDTIKFPDSLKFKTPAGKIVYGGGGIMPDVFVPFDTSGSSGFYTAVSAQGIITQFAYDYVDANRKILLSSYKNFKEFYSSFNVSDELYKKFISSSVAKGIEDDKKGEQVSSELIRMQLKAYIARQFWKDEGFYPVIHQVDKALKESLRILEFPETVSK